MNIFVLSECPIEAAQMQCDKHVVKMIVETAQMLCTVGTGPYKRTHASHPCTVWAGRSQANFEWLVAHGLALCSEYTYRYGKRHRTQDVIEGILEPGAWAAEGLTEFALAMPDEYKRPTAVESYRAYYHSKSHFARWTRREVPGWWQL